MNKTEHHKKAMLEALEQSLGLLQLRVKSWGLAALRFTVG